MADLALTGQSSTAAAIRVRTDNLKNAMEQRKEIWKRMPLAKKKAWITSGRDPIMTLAWQVYRYLRDNFFTQEVD